MSSPHVKRRERRRRIVDSRNNRPSGPETGCLDQTTKLIVPTGQNFASCYMELCKQQRIRPLPVICVTLPHCLDFTTDRVKMNDWGPILNSLTLDRSLRSISVKSRYQCRKPLEEINSEEKVRKMGKNPVVLTRYLLEWLCHSVAQCLRNSPVLTCLELEGIPLPADCLVTLCVGLASTKTLQNLSLARCYIGDESCELVCRTVTDVQSIRILNLSHCDLSDNCGTSLAAALSRQKLSLYHDTWKQSLRYREPNLEAMPGLRRLTLNGNPRLGDAAINELIEAIRDSLWLKAIDLQQCGLTNHIAKGIIELLDSNRTLSIIDVRMNANLEEGLMNEIFRRLEANNAKNGRSDYRWLSLPQRTAERNVVSAGAKRRNRCADETCNDPSATRPKSAFVPKTRRPFVSAVVGKNISTVDPIVSNNRRTRLDASIATCSTIDGTAAATNKRRDDEPRIGRAENENLRKNGRLSLHVDLCAQMDSSVVNTEKSKQDDKAEPRTIGVDNESDECLPRENDSVEELSKVLKQLSEARMEHDRLVDETRRTELLLNEERLRRESAETKLESMKRDLAELQVALREKETETRGFLLIRQRSLDDIAESFDRLLEMLDHAAMDPRVNARHPEIDEDDDDDDDDDGEDAIRANQDYTKIRAEMRRRVARLIRKTKSESRDAGLSRVERDETGIIRATMSGEISSAKKFAKSEGDMRNSLPPLAKSVRIERNIGDSPDVMSSRERRTNHGSRGDTREMADRNKMASPSACARVRARALFAQIVNGEPFLHLGAHGS